MNPGESATLFNAFTHVQANGSGWMARCPAHEDQRSSLSIGSGDDGRWLLKCHAGCPIESILTAAHLTKADLFPGERKNESGNIVAEYDYRDEEGELLYQAVRLTPKTFRQRRPDGQGGWTWNLGGVRRVLYRLIGRSIRSPICTTRRRIS